MLPVGLKSIEVSYGAFSNTFVTGGNVSLVSSSSGSTTMQPGDSLTAKVKTNFQVPTFTTFTLTLVGDQVHIFARQVVDSDVLLGVWYPNSVTSALLPRLSAGPELDDCGLRDLRKLLDELHDHLLGRLRVACAERKLRKRFQAFVVRKNM